jgi:hypothetical protein
MKMACITVVTAVVLITTILGTRAAEPARLFSETPIWTSGSKTSGGDGNARWIDVDNDGRLDLVTSAPDPRRWVIFRNQGGRLAAKPFWESAQTTDCDHVSVVDFNKDGRYDLAATHESHCTLYINESATGRQPFRDSPTWETGFYTDANQIDFGDFDNDGDTDMLMASGLPFYGLAVFENLDGSLAKTVSRRVGPREYCETAIFADFDADGDLDIIAAFGKAGTVFVYVNDHGQFDAGRLIYSDREVAWCQRIYCIDIDQDGHNELFCAKGPWGPPGASVALARQRDAPAMKTVWRSAPGTGFHGFDFGDVDKDGDLDVAAADWAGRSVSVFLQENGQVSPTPAWSAKATGPAHEVMFGDLDGDGDLDLAVGCLDQALVYENRLLDAIR